MPSQSRLEGSAIPDHWIRTASPDLERVVVLREMVTFWWVGTKKRVMVRKEQRKVMGLRKVTIFFGSERGRRRR